MADAKVKVELVAETAKFEADMKHATDSLRAGAARIQGAFAAIGVGLSVGAFTAFIKGAIDAADHLGDLSKATGVAASTLGGIGFAAKQAGADLDSTVKAFGKLNVYIAEAANGNADAVENFRRLGISINDLNTLKPEQIFLKVAAALEKYEDGPQKAALANAIFKKSYQEMLPLLGEGSAKIAANISYWKQYSGVTDDVVKRADEFNDTLGKLKLLTDGLATSIASELLGPMQAFADILVSSKEKGEGFKGVAEAIAREVKDIIKVANAGVFWVGQLAKAIDSLGESGDAFIHGNLQAAQDARQRFLAKFAEDYETFVRQQKRIESGNTGGATFDWSDPKKPKAPGLSGGGGSARVQVDEFAKAWQRVREQAIDAGVAYQEAFSGDKVSPALKALERLQGSDVWEKFTKTQQEALTNAYKQVGALEKETEAWKAKREEQEKLIKVYQEIEAVELRAREQATQTLGDVTERNDAFARSIAIIGKGAQAYDLLNAELQHNKDLNQAIAAGGDTVDALNAQYERQKLLIASYHEANEALQTQIEYNRIFAQSFVDNFVAVVDGTKSVSQAFKDMARSIVHDINEIAAKNIAKALFGIEDSGGGGIGKLIAEFLAGSGGGTGIGFPTAGFASGGSPPVGIPSLVGEHGPELFVPQQSGVIVPNDVLNSKRAARTVNIVTNITVPGNTSRATAAQIGVQVGIAASRAMRSNA